MRQHCRQLARMVGVEMHDHDERDTEAGRQGREESLEGADAPGRGAYSGYRDAAWAAGHLVVVAISHQVLPVRRLREMVVN